MVTYKLIELCHTINNKTGVVTYYRIIPGNYGKGSRLRISRGEYEKTYNSALEYSCLSTTNNGKYTRHYTTCKLGD